MRGYLVFVVRYALALLFFIVGFSYYFSHIPVKTPPPRDKGVVLQGVTIRLYPKSDPKASWIFSADRIENNPARQFSVVSGLKSGARYVNGKLDLTLSAPSVSIDRNDNLTMPYAHIEIPQECYQIDLGGENKAPVRILQNQGFNAPTFKLSGPGISIHGEGFTSDFKLEEASWQKGEDIVEMDNVKECKQ